MEAIVDDLEVRARLPSGNVIGIEGDFRTADVLDDIIEKDDEKKRTKDATLGYSGID